MRNKILNRVSLIKFWVFFESNYYYRFNFDDIIVWSKANFYSSFVNLFSLIKKLTPIILNISELGGNFFFLATNLLYVKSLYNNLPTIQLKVFNEENNRGVFSNFSYFTYAKFKKFDINSKKPTIAILYSSKEKDFLFWEAKKQMFPTIGLSLVSNNSTLLDYPLLLNSSAFHTIYFINKFFFKIIFLNKNKNLKKNKK